MSGEESNADQLNKLYSLQDNFLTTINKFNVSINKLKEVYNKNNQNYEISKRFDTLLNSVWKNNAVWERQWQQSNGNINHMLIFYNIKVNENRKS